MKLIELHILQSFPVSCLNRDDVGSPKSALFGGVKRARISSQCLKRASRLQLQNHCDLKSFSGQRGRFIVSPLTAALRNNGLSDQAASEWAIRIAVSLTKAKKQGEKPHEKAELEKIIAKLENEELGQVSTAVYMSPFELQSLAALISKEIADTGTVKSILKCAKIASIDTLAKDGVDIALFGRMVAADATLNVEGASMFAHALSTHRVDNEVDYFSTVEEYDKEQAVSADSGAAMIGTLEFNSATYYRYVAVNLDLLADEKHLGALTEEERKDILRAFIRAALVSVPGARQNSMNAGTLPHEVLGIRKNQGQPLQLVNAFERPVPSSKSGFAEASLTELKEHLARIEATWSTQGEKHFLTETDGGLDAFINHLLA